MPATLVIIPAFNEASAIAGVLDDLRRWFPEGEALVVDDGSRDDTAAVARRHGARVAVLPYNMGVGAALRTGFRLAASEGYSRAVQFDGDGQHRADEIPKLMRALDAGANMVVGSRFGAEAVPYRVGMVRGGAIRCMRALASALMRQRFTDTSSGFRAFDRRAVDLFAYNYPREYLSDTVEALLMAGYSGFDVREVTVRMRLRESGVPSNRNFMLVYHYLRMAFVMLLTASIRRHPAPESVRAD